MSYELFYDQDILKLKYVHKEKWNPIWVDFVTLWKQLKKEKVKRTERSFFKALGLASKTGSHSFHCVWEGQCGLGKDALTMLFYGLEVWSCERSPEIYRLLEDALKRATLQSEEKELALCLKERFHLFQGDCVDLFAQWQEEGRWPHLIYLDPMYSHESKRTALSQKEMRILHEVVGDDEDVKDVFYSCLRIRAKRLLLKRPKLSGSFFKPDLIYQGGSTRYDVYLERAFSMNQKIYDVYGIGNALVDMELKVDQLFLEKLGINKGTMTLIDEQRHNELLSALDSLPIHRASGGSVANSVQAMAQLGGSAFYACRVSDDDFGHFFINDLRKSGVVCRNIYHKTGATGKCLVFITPDADRTLNTYLGITQNFGTDDIFEKELAQSHYLYIEGYLLASPLGFDAAFHSKGVARCYNTKVALTFSDPTIVSIFHARFQELVTGGIDLIFCNQDEAKAFAKTEDEQEAFSMLRQISKSGVMTRGSRGSLAFEGDKVYEIAPFPVNAIDTTGAGDTFAGAFLYALSRGHTFPQAGILASKASSLVVTQYGPRLTHEQLQNCLREI